MRTQQCKPWWCGLFVQKPQTYTFPEIILGTVLCVTSCGSPGPQGNLSLWRAQPFPTSALRALVIDLYFFTWPSVGSFYWKGSGIVSSELSMYLLRGKARLSYRVAKTSPEMLSLLLGRGFNCTTCRNNIYLTHFSWMSRANDLKFFRIASI